MSIINHAVTTRVTRCTLALDIILWEARAHTGQAVGCSAGLRLTGTLHRPSSSDRKDGQGQRFVTVIKNIFTHKLKPLEGQLFLFLFSVGYYFLFFEKGVINWVIFFSLRQESIFLLGHYPGWVQTRATHGSTHHDVTL